MRQVDIGDTGAGDLADPQSGSVGALHDGAVSQLDGAGNVGGPGLTDAVPGRSGYDIEEPFDILDLHHLRQARRTAGRDDGRPGIAGDPALPATEAVERPQCGDSTADGRP